MEDLQQFTRALEDRNKEIETKIREAQVASMVAATNDPKAATTAATMTSNASSSVSKPPPTIQLCGYTNEMDMTRARTFVKRIEDHFRKQPQLFQEFLDIVTSADAGFLECHDSMSKVKHSIMSVRSKIKSLIGTGDSNDLFDTFLTFLPENVALVRKSTTTTITSTSSSATAITNPPTETTNNANDLSLLDGSGFKAPRIEVDCV